mmetsp:Transcript_3347/g.3907  ORF Transcript_3347/g.3907 Transcript_3347/m.3907 type:complete len:106 (+) Transcript_3347:139-456(+)
MIIWMYNNKYYNSSNSSNSNSNCALVTSNTKKNDYNINKNLPSPIAIPAPITVLIKLTTSFVIHSNPFFPCIVAPIQLSALVARNAAIVAIPTLCQLFIKPMANP